MHRLPAIGLPLAAAGCQVILGNGVPATESVDLEPLTRLHATNLVDVVITSGVSEAGTLTCDENLLPHIDLQQAGDLLTIRTVPRTATLEARTDCTLELEVQGLEELVTTGSGDITSTIDLEGVAQLETTGSGNIDLAIAGASDVTARSTGSGGITVDDLRVAGTLTATTTGSGDIALEGISATAVEVSTSGDGQIGVVGSTTDLDLSITGSGDIGAASLQTVDAKVRLTASGNAEIRASGRVTGRLSGSGDLTVFGNPDEVDVSTSGSGTVDVR